MAEVIAPSVDAGQGNPPAPNEGGAPPAWYNGADEITTGYIQNKGWDNPLKAVESYRNLEKLMGADKAGNAVVIPKPDAPPEEFGKFYERLGRPSDAASYKFDVPEGSPKEYADGFRTVAHELGLTQKQVEGLAKWNNGFVGSTVEAQKAQQAQAFQADDLALKSEWGAAFTQNLAAAQAAARALGLDEGTIDKLQGALGHKATMNLLYQVGAKSLEPGFVTGDKTEKFGAALTPAQAKAQIAALTADKEFVAKYVKGDAEARAKMEQLHKFAHPGGEA